MSDDVRPDEREIDPVLKVSNPTELWLAEWPRASSAWFWFEAKSGVVRPVRGPFDSQDSARAWFRFSFPNVSLPEEASAGT